MLCFALLLLGWLGYNLFIERQKEFKLSILPFSFMSGLFYVGSQWVMTGWESVGTGSSPKKGFKKKKKRPPADF